GGGAGGVEAGEGGSGWRKGARAGGGRNQAASLILGAGYVARSHRWWEDRRWRGHEKEPYPSNEHLEQVKAVGPEALLCELDGVVRENDQFRACAVVQRYGQAGHPARPVVQLLLRYAG